MSLAQEQAAATYIRSWMQRYNNISVSLLLQALTSL
jgi:hypothetical protein